MAAKWSDAFKRDIRRAIREKITETGLTPAQVLVGMLYDDKTQDTVKAHIFGKLQDALVVKESHKTVEQTVTHKGPVVLPPLREDPSKIDFEAEAVEEVH